MYNIVHVHVYLVDSFTIIFEFVGVVDLFLFCLYIILLFCVFSVQSGVWQYGENEVSSL